MIRNPVFQSYTDIINEIQKLQKGYTQNGNWTLGQICSHLSYYYRGSLEGFSKPLPWIIRATIGKIFRRLYLSEKPLKKGGATDPKSVALSGNENQQIQQALDLLKRLEKNQGPLKPSSLIGELSNDEWKHIHLKHSAHHLGFLSYTNKNHLY